MALGGVFLVGALWGAPEGVLGQVTCDQQANYSIFEAMHPDVMDDNVAHITAAISPVNWTQSMYVRGSIVIDPGGILNITGENTTIYFADSRNMGYTCNIVVDRASTFGGTNSGRLNIDAATVTSICSTSMWDGVRVLGWNSNGYAYANHGRFEISNNGTISNAVVGATNCLVDPMNPATAAVTNPGGNIRCTNARFINNIYDVVMRPFNFTSTLESQSRFINTQFLTLSLLNYSSETPRVHLWLQGIRRQNVLSCLFGIPTPIPLPVHQWGTGIRCINTPIGVRPETDPGSGNFFTFLTRAVDVDGNRSCLIRNNYFAKCAGGIRLNNALNAVVTDNGIEVPDIDAQTTDFLYAYGLGVWGGTGFTIERNTIVGINGDILSDPVTVGAIFDNTGNSTDFTNEYANNTFDQLTYGTFIQQVNDGPNPDDGLDLRCNDYGTGYPNSQNFRDIAFTGPTPRVGDKQGAPYDGINQQLLAGNTFTLCGETDLVTNMVEDIGNVNMFTYWHHAPTAGFNLNAHCRAASIGDFHEEQLNYTKAAACADYVQMFAGSGGQQSRMQQAHQEYALLRAVYDSQRDGGNTELLKEYVSALGHSSSDVRSALMLAAPKVSIETWTEVFKRETPLNPWHMAQALLANSPLQPEVVRMMEESKLTAYYKQLVLGGQGGGINSQTILESEMNHWKGVHARALKQLAADAVEAEDITAIDAALALEAQYPEMGTPWTRIHLLIAKGDLAAAKAVVDGLNDVPEPNGALEVLGMSLELELAGTALTEAPTAMLERLEYLADNEGGGMFAAQGWLRLFDDSAYPERILLPRENRSLSTQAADHDPIPVEGPLAVYPNPAKAQDVVYVVVKLPEGMENGTMQVFDPLGREVTQQRINTATAVAEIPVTALAPGLCVAVLNGEGLRIGSVKFELTH